MDRKKIPRQRSIMPTGLALILCDEVWQDPATLKDFILGVFHSIEASEFPCTFPRITLYFVLTGGRGKIQVTIRIVDSSGEDEIHSTAFDEIDFATPLLVVEQAVALSDVEFPYPDEYRVQIVVGENVIIERRLLVSAAERTLE